MKRLILLVAASLTGCATSPQGLAETRVEKTIESGKSSQEFATCVAESLTGNADLRSSGEHYWVLRYVMGTPRHRWDFKPLENGSVAELRSTGLAGSGESKVRRCA